MARYFMRLAYNGSSFHGWQIQPNANSVQEEIQKALTTLLRKETTIVGAGRTDTGVHAKEMFAHFEEESGLDLKNLQYRLNRILPPAIAIYQIFEVEGEDHTRFTALSRTYEYWLVPGKDPFYTKNAYKPLHIPDVDKMNKACRILFEFMDFSCFSKSGTQTVTNNCKIIQAHWEQKQDLLVFTIQADRFLRNMVRAITGTLLRVGNGELSLDDFRKVIESKNRSEAGESVPAHALYLTKVEYPPHIEKKIIR